MHNNTVEEGVCVTCLFADRVALLSWIKRQGEQVIDLAGIPGSSSEVRKVADEIKICVDDLVSGRYEEARLLGICPEEVRRTAIELMQARAGCTTACGTSL